MTTWKYFDEAAMKYNGNMEDPGLVYKGRNFDYFLIEDTIYEQFKEYAEEQGVDNTEQNFVIYCKENKESIREIFENNMEEG